MCSDVVLLGRLNSAHCRQRCPASQEPERQSNPVFWERFQPALHSGNEDFHLRFKGKKGSEGNKQDEMEGKCVQNSNFIGFILIGFLK